MATKRPEIDKSLLDWCNEAFGQAAYISTTAKETCTRDQHMMAAGRLEVYLTLCTLYEAGKIRIKDDRTQDFTSRTAQVYTAAIPG